MRVKLLPLSAWLCAGLGLLAPASILADEGIPTILSESRQIDVRPPEQVENEALPPTQIPGSVYRREELPPQLLTLDEAIRIALANDSVIRLLAGNTAVTSGRTIYDPAIANTLIDAQQARFDPVFALTSSWGRAESPFAFFDPLNPGLAAIDSTGTGSYNLRAAIDKTNSLGGVTSLGFSNNPFYLRNQLTPLQNQGNPATELGYSQPLLRGAGQAVNLAPIVIARIGTERSFYQLKDSVQEQVRGVVEGYWGLVVARVDVWVRRRQVEQAEEALRVGEARFRGNINDIAQVAQARSALANFRATLVTAEANLIQREAALRNLLGLPPSDGSELVPVTDPRRDRYLADWNALCDLAAEYRPDLIDLRLALQSDQQSLIQAENSARPRVDAFGLYRWKGLYGQQTDGSTLDTSPGAFQDWSLGVNLQVPLGLRQGRAAQRQVELALARDRANLDQGRHAAVHQLATTTRLVDQTYEQFLAFTEARKAARQNLQYQMALFENGRTIYLNVLQAITDWGNTISSEANALTQYNTQLAALERQTGTILETHGVYFYEEQFASTGLGGRFGMDRCYPLSLRPDYPGLRYPSSERPADESFELEKPRSVFGEDPLPEMQYDREPGDPADTEEPGLLPRSPVERESLDRSAPEPDLPNLPALPPPPQGAREVAPAPPQVGVRPRGTPDIPLPPVGDSAVEDDPLAAAAKPWPQSTRRSLPPGRNRLQQPDQVTPVSGLTATPPARQTPTPAAAAAPPPAPRSLNPHPAAPLAPQSPGPASTRSATETATATASANGTQSELPSAPRTTPQKAAARKPQRPAKLPTFWDRLSGKATGPTGSR